VIRLVDLSATIFCKMIASVPIASTDIKPNTANEMKRKFSENSQTDEVVETGSSSSIPKENEIAKITSVVDIVVSNPDTYEKIQGAFGPLSFATACSSSDTLDEINCKNCTKLAENLIKSHQRSEKYYRISKHRKQDWEASEKLADMLVKANQRIAQLEAVLSSYGILDVKSPDAKTRAGKKRKPDSDKTSSDEASGNILSNSTANTPKKSLQV
jgi:hypothetical protein